MYILSMSHTGTLNIENYKSIVNVAVQCRPQAPCLAKISFLAMDIYHCAQRGVKFPNYYQILPKWNCVVWIDLFLALWSAPRFLCRLKSKSNLLKRGEAKIKLDCASYRLNTYIVQQVGCDTAMQTQKKHAHTRRLNRYDEQWHIIKKGDKIFSNFNLCDGKGIYALY